MRNHYEVLGLEPHATAEEIRRAYRKLSLKFHPDKNPNDDYFAAMFRQVNEAYSMLSDSEKRRLYDEARRRVSDAQSFAEVLKNKERELAFKEQQLRARQNSWQAAVDQVVIQPLISPRTNKRSNIKQKHEPMLNIRYLKYSLYAVIVSLMFLIGTKNKAVPVPKSTA